MVCKVILDGGVPLVGLRLAGKKFGHPAQNEKPEHQFEKVPMRRNE